MLSLIPILGFVGMATGQGDTALAIYSRIYFPAGDRRRSHSHLYLVSLSGALRRIGGDRDTHDLFWADRRRLCWFEGSGTSERKVSYDISTRRSKVTKEGPSDMNGDPRAGDDDGIHRITNGYELGWNGKRYAIENPSARWLQSSTADGKSPFGLSELAELHPARFHRRELGKYFALCLDVALSAHDVAEFLFIVDPVGASARVIPMDAATIQIDPSGRRFVAFSGRCVASLGKLGVWMSDVYVGELPTGRFHRLPLPPSYTTEAAIRPLEP